MNNLYILTPICLFHSQNDSAIKEYTKCLAYSRIVHGPSHWKHARSIGILAQAYLDLKGN